MNRFAPLAALGSPRLMLFLGTAVLALFGAIYIGKDALKTAGYLSPEGCDAVWPDGGPPPANADRCALNSDAWRFPVAVLLGVVAVGLILAAVQRLRTLRRFQAQSAT